MKRVRLTIRARLTLLYTGLFTACAAVVVAITYGLVANLPGQDPLTAKPGISSGDYSTEMAEFIARCQSPVPITDETLRIKCDRAFREGVMAGAKSQRDATLRHLLQYSLLTLVAATAFAAVAGWIVAGRVLRPVHRITAAAREASHHNLAARVSLTGPRDELRELADTFDEMLGRLQASFESQRRFVANASHELRTPLTVMRATVDVVLAKPQPTRIELNAMGHDIRGAVDQAESLMDALLALARSERGVLVREQVDLATVVEDILDSIDAGDRHVHLQPLPAVTTGDPVLLGRLVANLVDNAVRHNVERGQLWVDTSTVDGRALLRVANSGPIITPETVGTLFEPFKRRHDRMAGEGLGLGLAIVASIVAAHGGTVAAQPLTGGGLDVAVTLPGNGFPASGRDARSD